MSTAPSKFVPPVVLQAVVLLILAGWLLPGTAKAGQPKATKYVSLSSSTGASNSLHEVFVEVTTAVPRTVCRGSLEKRGRRSERLPPIRTGPESGARWRFSLAARVPAGRVRASVQCRFKGGRYKAARTLIGVRQGPPGKRNRRIAAKHTVAAQRWRPPADEAGSGSGGTNLYPPGQCTFFAKKKRPDLPYFADAAGDAKRWGKSAERAGWPVDGTPAAGDIAVFSPGQHGAGVYGHVSYVEKVVGDQIQLLEANRDGRGNGGVTRRTIPYAGLVFVHRKGTAKAAVNAPTPQVTATGPNAIAGDHNAPIVGNGNGSPVTTETTGGSASSSSGGATATDGSTIGNGNNSPTTTDDSTHTTGDTNQSSNTGNGNATSNGSGNTTTTQTTTTNTTNSCTSTNASSTSTSNHQTSGSGSNTNSSSTQVNQSGCQQPASRAEPAGGEKDHPAAR